MEERFRAADKDNDGKVTKEEFFSVPFWFEDSK
jgi:Ca2+-binding EF-hand superfamily protein